MKKRESGIELLKILAIFLIVLFHTTQSLCSGTHLSSKYTINWNMATPHVQELVIHIFGNFAGLGNTIFFVCSAWFLCKSQKVNIQKILYMLADVWIISFIWLIVILSLGFNITKVQLIKELLPNTFSNNWYITAYIIFYLIHPALNLIINNLTRKQHKLIIFIGLCMYFFIDWLKYGMFFPSVLIDWLIIYFVVAYIRKYNILTNKKVVKIWFCIGLLGMIGVDTIWNFICLNITSLEDKAIHWQSNTHNPFVLLLSLSLFALAYYKKGWISNTINYISGLSLLIYIIHENQLFRDYLRPYFFIFIYKTVGYEKILIWLLLYAIGIFLCSLLLALLYKLLIQKLIYKVSDNLYFKLNYLIKNCN